MPRRNSRSIGNWLCSNAPQPWAARFVIKLVVWSPMFILVAEQQVIKTYSLHLLRLIYICPALSIVASVITVVAYCKRISSGYIIALALNGTSLLGWIVALGWLIISRATSSGYFAKLSVSDFFQILAQFLMFMGLALTFEVILCFAYLDSKHEAHASNSIDQPFVPETSMNPGSAKMSIPKKLEYSLDTNSRTKINIIVVALCI